jgi:two-component system, cell cycle sensor histidine kinase DivJ
MGGQSVRSAVANFLLDAFDGVLGAEPASDQERRQAFVSANLMAGAVGVALWPLHWALFGPVDFATGMAFFFLWTPLALGLWVKGGGDLAHGEAGSAFCLGGFVTFAAIYTGGLGSPALPWLLIVPVEAAISGRRSAVTVSALAAGTGFFIVSLLSLFSWLPLSRLDPAFAGFAYAASLFAALIVGTLALRAFQRRQAQDVARARAEAAMHRALTDSASDLITRHTGDGTVLYASPAAEEMLGVRARELVGLSPAMMVHIQDLKTVEQALMRAGFGEPQALSFRLRRRDGSYIPVEMRAQAAGSEIVAVTRDMSERTAEIVELASRRDEADEALRARTRFLASITHELRTPLNAIIGFSDVMRNEIFGPVGHTKYREYADHIRNSGMHLVDLVSDLLDMSKIEAGKFTIERRMCDVKTLADESATMVRGQAEEAGVELVVDVPASLSLSADARAIKQSLINLMSNAIKFTPSEGRVTLSARAEGSDIVINVMDTGVGIPEKDLARIGKPFEQVEGAMQRLHKGTGLGLSLVKSLTELHGGEMSITSALGDGTTVTLRLPIVAAPIAPAAEGTLVYPAKFRARA